eukprot:4797029-Pleurochrysis_carterae.AAC.1
MQEALPQPRAGDINLEVENARDATERNVSLQEEDTATGGDVDGGTLGAKSGVKSGARIGHGSGSAGASHLADLDVVSGLWAQSFDVLSAAADTADGVSEAELLHIVFCITKSRRCGACMSVARCKAAGSEDGGQCEGESVRICSDL